MPSTHALLLGHRGFPVVGVHELHVRARGELLSRVAQSLFPGRVHPQQVPVEVGDAHHVAGRLEECRELLLRALVLGELADLARDRVQHLEEPDVGLRYRRAEELEHTEDPAVEQDRNGESGVKPVSLCDGR